MHICIYAIQSFHYKRQKKREREKKKELTLMIYKSKHQFILNLMYLMYVCPCILV